jgi:NADH-quinone oxidoreductase subunit L
MTIPLMLLAVGAVAAGWLGIPPILGGGGHFAEFLKPVVGHPEFHASHAEEWGVMALSTTLVFIGLGLAAFFYLKRTDLPAKIAKRFSGLYNVLYHKYYVDEFYDFILIKPTLWVAKNILVGITDAKMIEGVVNGLPGAIGKFSQQLRRLQTGLAQHYAIFMAAGAVFIIVLVILFR